MSPIGSLKKPTEMTNITDQFKNPTAEQCYSVANAYDELIIRKRQIYDEHIRNLEAKRGDWLQKAANLDRHEKTMTAEYGPIVPNTEMVNGFEREAVEVS